MGDSMPERVEAKEVAREVEVPVIEPVEVPEELTIGKALQVLEVARAPAVTVTNKHELLINLKPLVRRTDEEVIPVLRSPFN